MKLSTVSEGFAQLQKGVLNLNTAVLRGGMMGDENKLEGAWELLGDQEAM